MNNYVLDAENRPVRCDNLIEWAQWWSTTTNRVVGYTEINSEITVSTVFLGSDHRFVTSCGKGPPILFETMVFGGEFDEQCWRYCSWDDAEAGHAAAVRKAREAAGQTTKAKPPA